MGDVDSNPAAAELLGGGYGSAATAKRVKYNVAGVATGLNNAL